MTIALDSTNSPELVATLEEAALNGLPALQIEFYDGWIVRMSEGYSRRANCVVPLYESTTPLQEKLVHCEAAYARASLPCLFKIFPACQPRNLDETLAQLRWGSVTFVQRFGSSLNLNPHVHVLMLDGVYVDGEEAPVFVAAPPLSDQAVRQIVETSARRIIRLCTKRGQLDDTAADPLADEEPVLAALTAASVRGLIATGARAGQRLRRALRDPAIGVRTASLCFASRGFSLHAATRIAGRDRRGLERLCRYVARPALASGRLRLLASQRLCFALKTPWSEGTSHLLLSPMELLEKRAALVPPPPVSSPTLPRGPGPPGPGPRPHRARQTG